MSNDWWSYENKDTYNAKKAQDWATKASSDAFSYLAPTTTGIPDEAIQQSPDNIFAPKPLITPQDNQGKSSGGLFKGIGDALGEVGQTAYDLTLKPINRVLEAEHNAIARPLAQALLSPFGDYDKLPGIVRMGAETLTDPLTYIGPGEVMDAFRIAKLAPELKLGAPALQALFDSPGSRRLLTHIVTSGGLGLAAVGGNAAAQEVGLKGLPAMAAGLGAAAIAGKGLGKITPEISAAVRPESSADDLRQSMETAWSKGRQSGHIDASMEANAKRLESFGSEDDLMQRMYDQTEMLQLKKKIDSGTATDEEMNRAGELVAKADALSGKSSPIPQPIYTSPDGEIKHYQIGSHVVFAEDSGSKIKITTERQGAAQSTPEDPMGLNAFQTRSPGGSIIDLRKVGEFIGNLADQTGKRIIVSPSDERRGEAYLRMGFVQSKDFPNYLELDRPALSKLLSPRLPPIGGGAAGSTEAMQNIIDRLNSSDPKVQQLINATSDIEVKANQQSHQGWTVGGRDKLGNFLESSTYGANLSNYLKSHGMRLHDTDATAYINEAGRLKGLGDGYSASLADNAETILNKANKDGSLPTSYVKENGTVVNDQSLIDQAHLADITGNKGSVYHTSKGSTYEVQSDGTTIRNKSFHPDTPTDVGVQDKSAKTYYVDRHGANAIQPPANAQWKVLDHGDGTISLLTRTDESQPWGISPSQRNIKVSTKPSVGLHPVELWKPDSINGADAYGSVHIGNDITSVRAGVGKKLINPDGSLSLHTVVNNPESFTLNPAQQATVSALTAPMSLHRGLEQVFGVEDQGPLAHVEPLSEKGNVSNGVNAVQNFERPQGELAGEKGYLPYADAQAARIQQGYHKIADSWLNATLDGMGKTASQLVPSELVDAINTTTNLRKQGHLLTTHIQNAIDKGSKVSLPEDFLNSPHLDPQIKDIAWAVTQPGMRAPQIQPLLDRLNGILAPVHALGDKQSAIMDEIRSGRGSQFRADYPSEFQGKYYPQDIGEQLNRYNQSVSPTGITKAVIDTNNLVRPIMATLDASFMGVQGLVAALSNPLAYYQAMKTLVTNGYGDYENTIRNSGRLSSMLNDGVHWAARNDAGEYLFPNAISKIPGIGRMADNSNTWFTQFGNVLRSELYNSVNWEGMTDIKRASLARTVNLMTGFSPNNPSNLESAVSFAPRFFRSQMGLIADAVTKHDMGPMGAARSLSTMIASGTALTYAMNEALGQKTDFNPESPNFLRVRVGGQDVAIFGTWDTLARALTKTYQTGNPLAGPEYLLRAKASPVMSKVYDLISGSTLQGTPIKWGSPGDILTSASAEAQSILPISASQIASNVAQDPNQLADPGFLGGQVLQFLGTKATPLSPSENMAIKRDTVAQDKFQKPWSQLEPYQQLQLHQTENVDLPAKSDLAKAFAFRRGISSQYQAEQEKIDSSLPVGKAWIDAYHNLQREKIGGFAQWNKEHPEAAAQVSVSKPKNANDAALQQFYQIFDKADKESWSPDELTQNVSDFQDSISSEQQAYIDRNTGLHDTQRVKDYKADQKILRPYWDIADTVYDRLKGRLPNSDSASSLQDYTSQLIGKMQDAGVPDQVIAQRIKTNPVLSEITRATGALRQKYRQTHPQTDKLLSKWYGYSAVAA